MTSVGCWSRSDWRSRWYILNIMPCVCRCWSIKALGFASGVQAGEARVTAALLSPG